MRSPDKMPARNPGESSIGAMTVTISVLQRDDESESAELSLRVVLQLLVIVHVHEFAVRIERADHALERGFDEAVVGQVRAVHITRADFFQHLGETFPGSRPANLFASAACAELK